MTDERGQEIQRAALRAKWHREADLLVAQERRKRAMVGPLFQALQEAARGEEK